MRVITVIVFLQLMSLFDTKQRAINLVVCRRNWIPTLAAIWVVLRFEISALAPNKQLTLEVVSPKDNVLMCAGFVYV